jgi:hypothetical protein
MHLTDFGPDWARQEAARLLQEALVKLDIANERAVSLCSVDIIQTITCIFYNYFSIL